MANKIQCSLPDDESLSDESAWGKAGEYRTACRWHLVAVRRRENVALKGPTINQQEVLVGTEVEEESEKTVELTLEEHIETSVSRSASKVLKKEWSKKEGARYDLGFEGKSPTFKGEISSETEERIARELTEAIQASLSSKTSYKVVRSKRERGLLKSVVPASGFATQTLTHHLNVFRVHWDIYLLAVDTIGFEHQNWTRFGPSRGRANERVARQYLRYPIARITSYEPQDRIAFSYGPYVPDVPDAESVEIVPLVEPCPKATAEGEPEELLSLAKLAFPVAISERLASRRRKTAVKKVAKKAAKKTAKKAAKKTAKKAAAHYHHGKAWKGTTSSAKKGSASPIRKEVAGAKPARIHGKAAVVKTKAVSGARATSATGRSSSGQGKQSGVYKAKKTSGRR